MRPFREKTVVHNIYEILVPCVLISYSVFILCINTRAAVRQVKAIAKLKGWELETRVVIEEGKLGVRAWRVT